jgi:hypothetical protein
LINLVVAFLPQPISKEKAIMNDITKHPFKLVLDVLKNSRWSCWRYSAGLRLSKRIYCIPVDEPICKTYQIYFNTPVVNINSSDLLSAYFDPSNKFNCICAMCGDFQVNYFNRENHRMQICVPPSTWSEDRKNYRINLIKKIYLYDMNTNDKFKYCRKRCVAHLNASCKCGFDMN